MVADPAHGRGVEKDLKDDYFQPRTFYDSLDLTIQHSKQLQALNLRSQSELNGISMCFLYCMRNFELNLYQHKGLQYCPGSCFS